MIPHESSSHDHPEVDHADPGHDELETIARERSKIVLRVALGLAIIVAAALFYQTPARALFLVGLIVFVPLKSAVTRYWALEKKKAELLRLGGTTHRPRTPEMKSGQGA